MNSDDPAGPSAARGGHGEAVRRRIVDAAAEILHGPPYNGQPVHGVAMPADPADRNGAVTVYLALLQDRLPVYARTMKGLAGRAGQGEVRDTLAAAARATIDFYGNVLASKVSVLGDPDQLMRLRRVLRARDLGPQAAHGAVAEYLEKERRLGRVPADADCDAAARLLVGACLHYAFTNMLLGEVPERERYIAGMVGGLRLVP